MDRKPLIQIDLKHLLEFIKKSEPRTNRYNAYCYKVPYIRINHEIEIKFTHELGLLSLKRILFCWWDTRDQQIMASKKP